MTRTDETKALTKTAFYTILGSGKPPTIDLINDWMVSNDHGKRQRNTISEAIKLCWEEVGERTKQTRMIPGIPDETVELVVALRDNLMTVAKAEFEADSVEIARHAQAKIEQAESKCTVAKNDLDIARNTLFMFEESLRKTQDELTDARGAAENTERKLIVASNLSQTHAARITVLEAEIARLQAEIARTIETHRVVMESEATRYSALQRSLQQQYDDEKTRAGKMARQVEKLEARLTERETAFVARERELSDQRAALSIEVGKWQGGHAALEQQIADLRRENLDKANKLTEVQSHAQALQLQAGTLHEQLVMLANLTPSQARALIIEAFNKGKSVAAAQTAKKVSSTTVDAAAYAASVLSNLGISEK